MIILITGMIIHSFIHCGNVHIDDDEVEDQRMTKDKGQRL